MNEDRSVKKRWPAGGSHSKLNVPPGNTPVIESPGANVNRAQGPQAYVYQTNTNTISTPILLFMLGCALLSGIAIAIAWNADYASRLGERNVQIARNHADDARYQVEVLRSVLQAYKIPLPEPLKQEEDKP